MHESTHMLYESRQTHNHEFVKGGLAFKCQFIAWKLPELDNVLWELVQFYVYHRRVSGGEASSRIKIFVIVYKK